MLKLISACAVAAGLFVAAGPASAGLVSYHFQAKPDSGPLAGTTLAGTFTFNDSQGTPNPIFTDDTMFALTAFSFTLNGTPYALADLTFGDAVFNSGHFNGLDAGVAGRFSLVPGGLGTDPFFAYALGQGAGNGAVVFALDVPEPAGALLLLAGLGSLATVRRKRHPS